MTHRILLVAAVAVASSAAVIAASARQWWPNLTLVGLSLLVAGVVLGFARGISVLGVVVVAAVCQLPGLTHAPITSTDAYRYVWDGRVQLSGRSPYAHVPLDDALAELRDPVLFPGLSPSERSGVTGPPRLPKDPAALAALSTDDPRTRINRPRVPTIYPPVAQAYFTVVAAVTPWSAGTLGLQFAAALIGIAVTGLLAVELRKRGRDPTWAALWGWSPVVALEAGNAGHVDVLAALLIVAAITSRTKAAGILIGAAASVKLLPLLLLPALTKRQPAVAAGTFITSYLPHIVAVGTMVLGFLPGYLTQEGFDDGSSRFAILALLLPPEVRKVTAAVFAITLAVVAVRRARHDQLAATCCWLYGAALLIATPTYPWYGLPLIALAVLAGWPEWLVVPLASYLAYASFGHDTRQGLIYLAAAVIVVTVMTVRHRTVLKRSLTRWPKRANTERREKTPCPRDVSRSR